jgi:putative hydrolase of the HAD superfamily
MIKPDLKIYQHICQKFDLVPAECVFFDDRKVNTDAAKTAGMQAFVFTTAQKARQDLETLIPLL